MNSYIGKVISNFRDFYNEINAATLTGAIDVVVVEQADGTFTCSPFHVRFGKLGVLRSREKVVDIEINGQPQDIHMKLGDSGEAFFVEEVQSTDSEYIPEHLATSPIPVSEFEELYTAAAENPRRKSIDLGFNSTITDTLLCANQTSDYTQRRYTGGMEKDYASQKREFLSRQLILGNLKTDQDIIDANIVNTETKSNVQDNEINDHEEVFEMEDLDNMAPSENVITVPKVFSAETIEDPNYLKNNFVPIRVEDLSNLAIKADIDSYDRSEQETKNGKKKRRKKSIMKKKNAQRKISTVGMEQNMNECKDNLSVQDLNIDTKISESSTDKSMLGSDESEEAVGTEADPSPSTRNMNRDIDFHFFSDTELTSANSANTSRPSTPIQSDTEFEFSQRKSEPDDEGHSWAWGQLPVTGPQNESTENKQDQQAERNSMLSGMFSFMKKNKHVRPVKDSEGLYLADLSSGNLDPEVAALYFPRKNKNTDADNDCESGNGPSLPQSPNSVEGAKSIDSDFDDASKDVHKHLQDISLSLCGWTQPPNPDNFLRNLITFSDLCNNPSVLESSELVVRINGKYYNWKSAIPIIISLIVYQRPLPQTSVEQLCMHVTETSLEDKLSKPESKSYSWWYWRRSKNPADKNTIQSESTEKNDIKLELEAVPDMPTVASSSMNEKTIITELEKVVINMKDVNINNSNIIENNPKEHLEDGGGYSGSQSSEDSDHASREMPNKPHPPRTLSEEKYRKTLRLSSEQIATLDLNEGMNEVEFSVTTAYQGTTRCKCHIYRWRYDDKIVISDIDGTITKSDVLGHILPIVGKDWAQSGVAQLFTKIKNNGYKLLYLSARAIGQARVTREYLRSIKQGNLSLPDGPLLLNPTSLISAFHREVIEKKPEQFKIQCLSDIQALFPIESNPFYAGYGNRINDVWAYRAVGIPIVRIFTINHKGELKHELTQTFQSTYTGQSLVVNDVFPQFKKTEIESS